MVEILVFLFCLIGCGVHCWDLGNKQGVVACLNHLEAEGILEFEDEDEPD